MGWFQTLLGDHAAAITADGLWRDAARIREELTHPDAERIRAKLLSRGAGTAQA